MKTLRFNFHDLAGLEVKTADRSAIDFYTQEYGLHLCESLPAALPLVRIEFSRNLPWSQIEETSVRVRRKFLGRWAYTLELTENLVSIRVEGNSWAVPLTFHSLVHCAIRYLVSYRGFVMLHSGAVTCDEKSLIFTGRGGVGKTTTSSVVLEYGDKRWRPHADDYVFLSKSAGTRSYITRSHLYRDLLHWIPAIRDRLTSYEKVRLQILGVLRQITNDWLAWPVRVSFDRLFPHKSPKMEAWPEVILLMERSQGGAEILPLDNPEAVIEELIQMNFYEARHFIDYVQLVMPEGEFESWLAEWKQREHRILSDCISGISTFRLRLPKLDHADPAQRAFLLDTLENLARGKREVAIHGG